VAVFLDGLVLGKLLGCFAFRYHDVIGFKRVGKVSFYRTYGKMDYVASLILSEGWRITWAFASYVDSGCDSM
jgi:hypothetical protein